MANDKRIKNHINELKVIKHHIMPKDLEIGVEYHVPPIISVKRMDIQITAKEGSVVKFKITSDTTEHGEKTMEESSILSRFIVKKHTF
jgi:hypothetical protein